ncbi:nuclear transport factor 2 family protein [Spirosoma endbachense]|nr:nuclear transport factor 2 family protein [Spirosoma endbachense]
MKMRFLLLVFLVTSIPFLACAQSAEETAVRKVSALEVTAFLSNDTASLAKLWSPNYVVMNPFNKIVSFNEIKVLMRNAKINQIRFDRIIEKITINQNLAIEMGQEIPDEKSAVSGVPKSVTSPRRFTNIWQNSNGSWQLIARQATNVSQ